ncbi:tRNA pseudouridine(55) synthase TruB [Devosia sp.]|uniref:tRNA pseudouridine(55) synthase TruB n=1 Tax=Devosia sp. TaxID=1871048 RepID=UPI003A8E7037
MTQGKAGRAEQPRRIKRDLSGWVVLDKPYDMTSTQAVGKLRWMTGAKKAGHAGTLDPLATGVLPIALGEATKTVPIIQDGRKVYQFELRWGEETTTDDAEGEVTERSDVRPSREAVEAALGQFTGTIQQVPPAFSAIKIDGERAYDLARAGEEVVMTAREVTIDFLTLISHSETSSSFEMGCAKGTYVRALARDLARALGTRAHVISLRRTQVGPFDAALAVTFAQLEAMQNDDLVLPVASGLSLVPELRLSAAEAKMVRHGNEVLLAGSGAPVQADSVWASHAGNPVALGRVEAGRFCPSRVFV